MRSQIVLHIGDIELRAESKDGEPTVLDLVIGERAGLARPRKIREHIRRGIEEGALREGEHFRREFRARQIGAMKMTERSAAGAERTRNSFEKSPSPRFGAMRIPERIDEEFWLTEAGTLKVITRLRTPAADAIVDDMIRVYRQAFSQLRAPERAGPTPVLSEVAHGPRVGDSAIGRREVAFYCRAAANACAVSIPAIHGFLRREFRVAGVYHLAVLLWPQAKGLLEALGMGRLVLPKRRPRLPAPAHPNQQRLWS